MKLLFTNNGRSCTHLFLILGLIAISHSACNHKSIQIVKKPSSEMQEGSEDNLFFQRFVAGKITHELRKALPDTLISVEVAKLFPGEDLQNIVLPGRYSVGGIYFTSENERENQAATSPDKVVVHLRYNLKELFAFAKNKLKAELQKESKISPELLEAITLSLEILAAYYESVAKIPLVGEVQTTLPHSSATTKQAFLTKLQIIYFQLIYEEGTVTNKRFKLQLRWNTAKFEEFLAEILARKYKLELIKKERGNK